MYTKRPLGLVFMYNNIVVKWVLEGVFYEDFLQQALAYFNR